MFIIKFVWTPVVDEKLECEKDTRAEAEEQDETQFVFINLPRARSSRIRRRLAVTSQLSCLAYSITS